MTVSANAIRSFVERLQRDVTTAEPNAVIGVFDLSVGRWIVQPAEDAPPEDFGDEGWVARIHGSELLLEDFENVLLELAGFAHDLVMDETGRSWPDVDRDGRSMHLDLESRDGDVWWAYKGEVFCAVGELPQL